MFEENLKKILSNYQLEKPESSVYLVESRQSLAFKSFGDFSETDIESVHSEHSKHFLIDVKVKRGATNKYLNETIIVPQLIKNQNGLSIIDKILKNSSNSSISYSTTNGSNKSILSRDKQIFEEVMVNEKI